MNELLRRPNLEYQFIYDLCAQVASQAPRHCSLVVSSPLHARELNSRIPEGRLVTAPSWKLSETDCVIWAEPSIQQSKTVLSNIKEALVSDGKLVVVVSGNLASRLSEWRDGLTLPPDETPLAWLRTRALLREANLQITQEYTFRGITTLLWEYASQLTTRIGRPDLTDRLTYKMRADFSVKRWQQPFSTLGLIVARA